MSRAQRTSLLVVPILLCAAAFGMIRWKHETDFRTLYTSLAPEDASAVTQKIREAGIEYRLDETGATVLVPSARLAEARLALAGAGLPRTGRIGFELFDRANLGASDFAEQVNYRRALEGELERTVASLSEVDQARIHITFPRESVFLDSRQPAKATVVLKLKRASQIPKQNVAAIANLVASAVDGLTPETVAIVDAGGRLLNRPRAADDNQAAAEDTLEYRRQIESEFLAKINSALEPILGEGRFRAGVNIECDFSSSEESEESFDPAKSVILTSQTSEESTTAAGSGGTPGTASNLPRPPGRAPGSPSGMVRKTENVAYQPSRSVRRKVLPRGSIRRVSTAVLVDQTVRWQGTGLKAKKTLVMPSAEVMKGIRDIVAGITGYAEQRGDQITVETLPFEGTLSAEPPPAPPQAPAKQTLLIEHKMQAIGLGVVGLLLVAAVVMLVIRRPSRRLKVKATHEAQPGVLPPAGSAPPEVTPGAQVEDTYEQQIADNEVEQAQLEADTLSRIKLPANTKKTEVLVKHIREAVKNDPLTAANVLRTWVSDADTKRTS